MPAVSATGMRVIINGTNISEHVQEVRVHAEAGDIVRWEMRGFIPRDQFHWDGMTFTMGLTPTAPAPTTAAPLSGPDRAMTLTEDA